MKMKRYRVVRDRQGGSFGMGRDFTADEWLQEARGWCYIDNDTDTDNFLENIQKNRSNYTDKEVIGIIDEIWDLDFKEIK